MTNIKDDSPVVLIREQQQVLEDLKIVTHEIAPTIELSSVLLAKLSRDLRCFAQDTRFTIKKIPLTSGKSIYHCDFQIDNAQCNSWIITSLSFGRRLKGVDEVTAQVAPYLLGFSSLIDKNNEFMKALFGSEARIQIVSKSHKSSDYTEFSTIRPKHTISCYSPTNIKLVEREISSESKGPLHASAAAFDVFGSSRIVSYRRDITTLENNLHRAAEKIKTGTRG